jgi:GH15 family glucan-1,4-alpha-glucosidase
MNDLQDDKINTSSGFLAGTVFGATIGVMLAFGYQYLQQILSQPALMPGAVLSDIKDFDTQEARALFIAIENLRTGILERRLKDNRKKQVLHAGYRNFRESWARDFGFAAYGLLALQDYRPAKETLEAFFFHQTPQGQLPVKLHSIGVFTRFLHSLFNREQPIETVLKPKFRTGHGTVSLDGQALLVIAAANYVKWAEDKDFGMDYWGALSRAMHWLDGFKDPGSGLLKQKAYADWADTVARRGSVLYTNVVYWKALHEMSAMAHYLDYEAEKRMFAGEADDLALAVQDHLWKSENGYFVTSDRLDNLSSAGNLLAIAWGLADEQQAHSILDIIQSVGMSRPVPTRVAYPPYSKKDIAIENLLAGLANYHTEAAWLWIGAWHMIALARTGRLDEARKLLSRMAEVVVEDGQVHEVYGPDGKALSSFWYTSESPLTWSAGMFVYAFHNLEAYF